MTPDATATLCGCVDIGSPVAGRLDKTASGRLWPGIIERQTPDGRILAAVDGYLVVDDRLLLGDGEAERQAIIDGLTADDPTRFLNSIQNGNFIIVVHDERRQVTRIVSSAEGLLPLYIHRAAQTITFSASLGGIRAAVGGSLRHDLVGLAELYWLGYQIGDRTPYEDTIYMAPGTILDIDWATGAQKARRWAVPFSQDSSSETAGQDTDRLVHEFIDLLTQSCRRLRTTQRNYGIKLSGGMDSRAILACFGGADLVAYNFGAKGAYETVLARHAARAFAARFIHKEIEGDFFSKYQLGLLDRYGLAEFFHRSLLDEFRETECDLVLDGILGDVFFGGLSLKRSKGLAGKLRNVFALAPPSEAGIRYSNAELAQLILSEIRVGDGSFRALHAEQHALLDAQIDSIRDDIENYLGGMPESWDSLTKYTVFAVNNRARRYIALQGASCRPTVEQIYPFLDVDLKRFAQALPPALISGKRFYMKVYRALAARSADLPSVNALVPASWPDSAQILGRIARRGIELAGYRTALLTNGAVDIGRINCNQWDRWIAFDRPLRSALRFFMDGSGLLNGESFDAALQPSWHPHGISGTRLMLTASYCGLRTLPGAAAAQGIAVQLPHGAIASVALGAVDGADIGG